MKQYPKYKESGIQWIGQVPEHWEVSKLKYFVECKDGYRVPIENSLREEGPYPYWGAGSITGYVKDFIFDEELVLLGEDGAPFFDKNRPVAFYSNEKIWVNNHIHVLKPKNSIRAKFLTYLLNSVDFAFYINGSILSKLTQSNMDEIVILLPPLSEQEAIAAYLDKQTGKIDKSIESLEQQKTDLQQYRTSLISEAVTHGLSPNTTLKDSGVQWIGQIPEEWICLPIKRFSIIQTGNTPSTSDSKYFDGGFNWFTPSDFQGQLLLTDSNRKLSQCAVEERACRVFPAGSIYIIGIGGTLGKVAMCEEPASANQQITVVSPNSTMNHKYVTYYLSTKREIFEIKANAATLPILSSESVATFPVPIPPLAEQEAIAAYLDEQTGKIDTAIATIDRQIADLRAYRTALITEAVTGKVDVRVSV